MDRYLDTPMSLHKKAVMLAGSLNTENTSHPTILNGLGFTATRTGAGVLQVAFADKMPNVISCVVSGEVAQTSVYTNTSGVVVIDITLTGGDVADKQINFFAFIQNSTIPAK